MLLWIEGLTIKIDTTAYLTPWTPDSCSWEGSTRSRYQPYFCGLNQFLHSVIIAYLCCCSIIVTFLRAWQWGSWCICIWFYILASVPSLHDAYLGKFKMWIAHMVWDFCSRGMWLDIEKLCMVIFYFLLWENQQQILWTMPLGNLQGLEIPQLLFLMAAHLEAPFSCFPGFEFWTQSHNLEHHLCYSQLSRTTPHPLHLHHRLVRHGKAHWFQVLSWPLQQSLSVHHGWSCGSQNLSYHIPMCLYTQWEMELAHR